MLAARLKVGVHTVERWERGGRPDAKHLFMLADLGIIDVKTASLLRPPPIHPQAEHPDIWELD